MYKLNEKVKFKISVEQDGKVLNGAKVQCEIGPEKIQPTTTMPDDFLAFWQKAMDVNAKVPLDAKNGNRATKSPHVL